MIKNNQILDSQSEVLSPFEMLAEWKKRYSQRSKENTEECLEYAQMVISVLEQLLLGNQEIFVIEYLQLNPEGPILVRRSLNAWPAWAESLRVESATLNL